MAHYGENQNAERMENDKDGHDRRQSAKVHFVKSHHAFDGKTPAQAAGLNVKGWRDLLKVAHSEKNDTKYS